MKLSRMLRRTIKEEGKRNVTTKVIVKLKNSREFNYLVDTTR